MDGSERRIAERDPTRHQCVRRRDDYRQRRSENASEKQDPIREEAAPSA
jgi:hypothetical protein